MKSNNLALFFGGGMPIGGSIIFWDHGIMGTKTLRISKWTCMIKLIYVRLLHWDNCFFSVYMRVFVPACAIVCCAVACGAVLSCAGQLPVVRYGVLCSCHAPVGQPLAGCADISDLTSGDMSSRRLATRANHFGGRGRQSTARRVRRHCIKAKRKRRVHGDDLRLLVRRVN